MVVGAALGVAGAILQGALANPLASPDVIGVTGGAGFGAILIIVLFPEKIALLPIGALLFGLLAAALVFLFAWTGRNRGSVAKVVLAGIAMLSLFTAGTTGLLAAYPDTSALGDLLPRRRALLERLGKPPHDLALLRRRRADRPLPDPAARPARARGRRRRLARLAPAVHPPRRGGRGGAAGGGLGGDRRPARLPRPGRPARRADGRAAPRARPSSSPPRRSAAPPCWPPATPWRARCGRRSNSRSARSWSSSACRSSSTSCARRSDRGGRRHPRPPATRCRSRPTASRSRSPGRRSSAAPTSRSTRASWSPWSGRTARASRPWSARCRDCRSRAPGSSPGRGAKCGRCADATWRSCAPSCRSGCRCRPG